jgi:hypothetical protein
MPFQRQNIIHYVLLVILIYSNTTSSLGKCQLQPCEQSTYFKVRVGCTRWTIRPYVKLYLYPERQSGEHLKEKKTGQNRQVRTDMIKQS